MLPRCHNIAAILDADSLSAAVAQFLAVGVDTFLAIVLESYLSLAAMLVFFLLTFCFAKSGGIGAVPGSAPLAARLPFWEAMALRCGTNLAEQPWQPWNWSDTSMLLFCFTHWLVLAKVTWRPAQLG